MLVGCNMRFHPGLKKVKRLIDEGRIGNVISVRSEFGQYLPDWHPWEDYRQGYSAQSTMGGGVILDAIHEIDYMRWMFGDVRAVSCFTGYKSHLEIDTEDTAAMLLTFSDGVIGEIHLDYVQRDYSRSCKVIGEKGTILWDYTVGEVRWFEPESNKWQVFYNPKGWTPNRMYVEELNHFIRCIHGKEEPTQDGLEAFKALKVALAAKASAENERVMRVGE
jgi:predicted dehydrogenase